MNFVIPSGLKIYILFYTAVFPVSVYIIVKNKRDIEFLDGRYWRFLFEPWKVATFIIGTLVITVAAPYSSDPTWDYPDSILISVLTYTLSPWSVGVLYRGIMGKNFDSKWFSALCFFFIPCWTYDLYILFRDGIYPPTWAPNLVLSGFIVLLAGLFWNIAWYDDCGTTFSFKRENWPDDHRTPVARILWILAVLSFPVLLMVGWFVFTV